MVRVANTCNGVKKVGKTSLSSFLTAEALRGVTIFDAQGNRIDNELGKRDYVTSTPLEQGCDLRQGSRGSSTRSSTSLSRCRGRSPVS